MNFAQQLLSRDKKLLNPIILTRDFKEIRRLGDSIDIQETDELEKSFTNIERKKV